MASEIEVYKAAALGVGSETEITSPTDPRPLAKKIRAAWNINRRAAIREGSWNFAMKRVSLPALLEAPAFGFSWQFQLPADFLRLIEVHGTDTRYLTETEFQIEGRKILCSRAAPLPIRYQADVVEPSLWDDTFAAAFGQRIACEIGRSIAGSTFDRDGAWGKYQALLKDAKRVDAMENPPLDQAESDWIIAREGGSWFQDPLRMGGGGR